MGLNEPDENDYNFYDLLFETCFVSPDLRKNFFS